MNEKDTEFQQFIIEWKGWDFKYDYDKEYAFRLMQRCEHKQRGSQLYVVTVPLLSGYTEELVATKKSPMLKLGLIVIVVVAIVTVTATQLSPEPQQKDDPLPVATQQHEGCGSLESEPARLNSMSKSGLVEGVSAFKVRDMNAIEAGDGNIGTAGTGVGYIYETLSSEFLHVRTHDPTQFAIYWAVVLHKSDEHHPCWHWEAGWIRSANSPFGGVTAMDTNDFATSKRMQLRNGDGTAMLGSNGSATYGGGSISYAEKETTKFAHPN